MNRKLLWLFIVAAILLVTYLFPVRPRPFEEIYRKVDPAQAASLKSFRQDYPLKQLRVNGVRWDYVTMGKGRSTILFLHGMAGACDIWWQQLMAMQDRYRVISVTYPAVHDLDSMAAGVLAILDTEQAGRVNVVGSSLGGYLAQYLLAKHPERVEGAVLSNTFPPNDVIAGKYRTTGMLLPFMPEWLVMSVFRESFRKQAYPAAGHSELVLAFLLEQSYGRMSKEQVAGRFRCVIEPFLHADSKKPDIPVMIIESDNDPLIEPALRELLKKTYPEAPVHTLHNAGHFPYLNMHGEYTQLLEEFLGTRP